MPSISNRTTPPFLSLKLRTTLLAFWRNPYSLLPPPPLSLSPLHPSLPRVFGGHPINGRGRSVRELDYASSFGRGGKANGIIPRSAGVLKTRYDWLASGKLLFDADPRNCESVTGGAAFTIITSVVSCPGSRCTERDSLVF
ncbi:hypothetical protein BaRGS_00002184 [Batillaria attramentaria]|uniref:Uncharacterized protein n=1 Tax=Batillaria attramentaria TaxID=370345 RepID=A0ABD0M5N4_9CAEN